MHETHWHGYEPEQVTPGEAVEPATGEANGLTVPIEPAPGVSEEPAVAPSPPKRGGRLLRTLLGMRKEVRIGLAAGLSVVILLGAFLGRGGRKRPEPEPTATTKAGPKSSPSVAKPSPAPAKPNQPAKSPTPTLALNAEPTPPRPPLAESEPPPDDDVTDPGPGSAPPPPALLVEGDSDAEIDPDAVEPPPPVIDPAAETDIGSDPTAATPPPIDLDDAVPQLPTIADDDPAPGPDPADETIPAAAGVMAGADPSTPPNPIEVPSSPEDEPTTPTLADSAPTPADPPAPAPVAAMTPAAPAGIPSLRPAPPASQGPASSDLGETVLLPHVGPGVLKVEQPLGEPRRTATAPASVAPAGARPDRPADPIQPVLHVVQKGENFATISRLYYGSMRYYRALWKANESVAKAPDQLYVGTTIRVPPPEQLDPALVERPKTGAVVASSTSAPRKDAEARRAGQTDRTVVDLPHGRGAGSVSGSGPIEARSPGLTHLVRGHETLRSIARDRLGDPRRESEILDLNVDQLSDSTTLSPGMRLRLPADATDTVLR